MYNYQLLILSILAAVNLAADCSQPRLKTNPRGKDLATLTNMSISLACQEITIGQGGDSTKTIQGYVWISASMVSLNETLCQEAFSNIIDQCISNDNYFGGEYIYDNQLFNLTNLRYPYNPILSGPGAPKVTPTSIPELSQFPPIPVPTAASCAQIGK
jgi:hypothetical protein